MTIPGTPPAREPETWFQGKMRPRSEVERIKREEAAAQMAGPVEVETPPPRPPVPMPATRTPEHHDEDEAGAGPVGTMRVEHDPAPEPAPVTPSTRPPRPARSSSAVVPLIEGISMEIANVRGTWYTAFIRDGAILTEDANRTDPTIDRRAPGRLTAALSKAVPTLSEKAIKSAIGVTFEAVRDANQIASEAVATVIGATSSVTIEMADPPITTVQLDGGGTMVFSAADMGNLPAPILNSQWFAARREILLATKEDFRAIAEYWLSVAEEREPRIKSVWEPITEKLRERIAPLPRNTDRETLTRFGVWQEPNGPLWILSTLIQSIVKEEGQSPFDSRFAQYLEREGLLIAGPKVIRAGVQTRRAWGFNPEFKFDLDDAPGGSLAEDPVGD